MTPPRAAPALVISHRGRTDAGGARENTLDAFRAAVALGADGIELDVRPAADGALVVHHDPALAGVEIARASLADIRAAAGRLGFEVPTLDEVLAALPASTWLDVEIKEPGCEGAVLAAVTAARPAGRVVVTSFRPACVAALRGAGALVPLGLLVGGPGSIGAFGRRARAAGGRRAVRVGADFLAPHWRVALPGPEVVVSTRGHRSRSTASPNDDLTANGAWVWTVNTRRMLRRLLADAHVAAVITDRPALALALRAEAGTRPPVGCARRTRPAERAPPNAPRRTRG